MRIEDENFEEEFLKWLNTKTQDEIIEGLKKYAINEQYSYSFDVNDNLNNEDSLDYIEVEVANEAIIDENNIYLNCYNKKKQNSEYVNKIIELEDAA